MYLIKLQVRYSVQFQRNLLVKFQGNPLVRYLGSHLFKFQGICLVTILDSQVPPYHSFILRVGQFQKLYVWILPVKKRRKVKMAKRKLKKIPAYLNFSLQVIIPLFLIKPLKIYLIELKQQTRIRKCAMCPQLKVISHHQSQNTVPASLTWPVLSLMDCHLCTVVQVSSWLVLKSC